MIEKISTPKKLKVPEKLKKLVLESVRRHAWNMGVSHYIGDILYMQDDVEKRGGMYVLAEVNVDRRYARAHFKIYPYFLKRYADDGPEFVESTIAHEVAHILTQHLYECATATYVEEGEMKDAWENLTEMISRVSVKLDREIRKKS